IQNALQTLLPQIRAEIREEFRTSSESSDAGGNPPPVAIHTRLERFNKQNPHSFEKATAPFFPRAEQERLKREYHSIRQTSIETSTEFMQRFLRLVGFLGAAAGTEEEQAKMVNTRTDTDLSAAVQNALQTLLPQIREEFRTGSGSSNAGGNPTPMVNTRTDADLSAAVQNAEIREEFRTSSGHSDAGRNPPPTSIETSTEFMQRFLRLAGFLGAATGTEEEQAKNFQWGLR
nr:zinc finger, CCHC-type, retrotransposon Gag domain protein [Tanacetum cinerariifolium]